MDLGVVVHSDRGDDMDRPPLWYGSGLLNDGDGVYSLSKFAESGASSSNGS